MGFNAANILKNSISLPIQGQINKLTSNVIAGVGSAATVVAGNITSNLQGAIAGVQVPVSMENFKQDLTNFTTATGAVKLGEAASKLAMQGQAALSSFSNLANGINLAAQNGKNMLLDAATNAPLGNLGMIDAAGGSRGATDPDSTVNMKVTLDQPGRGGVKIIFDVMPTIEEGRSTEYEAFSPLHHPGQILKYKTTGARTWSISARLISRNVEEATDNLQIINVLRAWGMPYYGTGTMATDPALIGAPPPVLTLSAYGSGVIGPVKCVLESYNWQWPNDVDFLPAKDAVTGKDRPFPVIISVSLSLKEAYSPAEFSGFSIRDYRRGNMSAAFGGGAGALPPPAPQTAVLPDIGMGGGDFAVAPGTVAGGAGGGRGITGGAGFGEAINAAQSAVNKISQTVQDVKGAVNNVRGAAEQAINGVGTAAGKAVGNAISGLGGSFGGGGSSGQW